MVKTGESGTRATEGQGAELQDSRLPLVLLLWLPSLMSQWSDKEELVEPAEEAKERVGPGTSLRMPASRTESSSTTRFQAR